MKMQRITALILCALITANFLLGCSGGEERKSVIVFC